jgi:Polysaccharide deacetylase
VIVIQIPDNYSAERHYILSVMFEEFLGLEIQVQISDRCDVLISMGDRRELIVTDGLFSIPVEDWLQPVSLPKQPLEHWNLATTELSATTVDLQIPVIYGDDPSNSNFFWQSEEKIYLGLDLFGSAFFMLTRYEEIVKLDRDAHYDWFLGTSSLAHMEGFLDRPIINEYLEILWACLQALYPRLERQHRNFQIYVSHDVDEPFRYALSGVARLLRRCGGDLIVRHSPAAVVQSISQWLQVKTGNTSADPCNTFDRLMDISERHQLKSAFYFITDHTGGAIDGNYRIDSPLIRDLLRKIHHRGHEIGLHPSYHTYKDAAQTKKEFEILKQVCAQAGIEQDSWGGRQHYLRWENPTTFQNWEDAGLDYDSTLAFPDLIGFRCGICYEFPVYNLKTRQVLKLRERPLIVMECTVIEKMFMNLGLGESAVQIMAQSKQRCQLFQGNWTLLWHNNRSIDRQELDVYEQLISC